MDLPTGRTSAATTERSCQLLIRDYPHRAIAIVSSTHALILRHSSTISEAIATGSVASVGSARPRTNGTGADTAASKCIVEFSPATREVLHEYRPLIHRPVYGTLGLISVARDVFLCVITHAKRMANLRPGETVERIDNVQFFCLNSAEWDDVYSIPDIDGDAENSMAFGQNLGRRDVQTEHPCQGLHKLLSNGTFYYSTDFDLTNRLQDRPVDATAFNIDNFDDSFLWNSYMIDPLVQFRSRLQSHEREALDASRILTSAIRGFCLTITIPQSSAPLKGEARTGMPSLLTVVSRLSCRRVGTRFNARGIDDDGNVANFVETETIYYSPTGVLFSYVQVRGSVPVFWEQTAGLIPGQQSITITRSPDGTQPAFNKHFEHLEQVYGAVHVVNLLHQAKPKEAELTSLYDYGLSHCTLQQPGGKRSTDHALLRSTHFDFHAETKGPSGMDAAQGIRHYIDDSAEGFAYYLAEEVEDDTASVTGSGPTSRRFVVVLQQEGVFRVNCLDCLDRTNLIQSLISQMAVEAFLGHRGEFATPDFWARHSSLWADNGDALSRTYAGTGALKSSFTRHGKVSLAGAFADARKSATRLWINNFEDKDRQSAIDLILGRLVGQVPVLIYDPISDYVAAELQKRSGEFSVDDKISMWVGTFNLNGRTTGINEDLSAWICPPSLGSSQPEIVAVGFQEIVELNPQQIMNTDPSVRQQWEKAVKRTLDARSRALGSEKYVLLRSGQLVGAALCIFVRASVLEKIKNVEGAVKKTGMSGIAGNKGAVAIRFDYANTQFCFVTAHLAAGFANYEERNRDYDTIHHGIRFQRNRRIDDHDTVIWFGDFNYRIGLSTENARDLIRKGDLGKLYENDQLNLQMVAGYAFPYYSEARITFMPTYKFDPGKDEYDTSEKARIPAWTDRVLRKGTNIRQTSYSSAPLRFSDHRPVYATFECTVSVINETVRDAISQEIYKRRKAEVGGATANIDVADTDDEELIGYDAVEPGLPPASSDRQKWWLENGKMARSTASTPKPSPTSSTTAPRAALNPKRSANPFTPSEESDWVAVPRSESRASSFSTLSSSPYEHVNHPYVSTTTIRPSPPQRKLPPPFGNSALPAKTGRLQLNDDTTPSLPRRTDTGTPPPPPPRRQTAAVLATNGTGGSNHSNGTTRRDDSEQPIRRVSTMSVSSSQAKSPPPPVAKKPAHLTSSVSPVSTSTSSSPVDPKKPQLPRRSSTTVQRSTIIAEGRAGPTARTSVLQRSRSRGADNPPQKPLTSETFGRHRGVPEMREGDSPQMPIRRQNQGGKTVDLLGDDGSAAMEGWATLKPR